MRGVGLAALALVAAASPAVALGASPPKGCAWTGPVVSHHQGGAVVDSTAGGRWAACGGPIGYATSETNIAITPKGTVLFSPAKTENSMGRSTDEGGSWTLTYPEDEQYTALWNTVDPSLAVDRQTGRLFWAHATGATRTLPILVAQSPLPNGIPTALAAASGFQVYSSADEGSTWKTADYQTAPMGDWEKVIVGPPRSNASAAERPAGYPNVVYICGNSPFEVSGPGRICYRSLDGGLTFAIAGYVTPSPNMPPDICPPLAANTGAVAPDGVMYQPTSCNGASYVAVSEDEGASYTFRKVPDAPPSNGLSGSLQLVIDDSGALYAEWVADDRLEYAVSRDQGRTWSKPVVISAPGVHVITRPAPAAGARGEFGVAYYGSTDAKATKLTLYMTKTAEALDSDPLLLSTAVSDPAKPFYSDGGVTGASPRADYIGAAFDQAGTLWAGGVDQLGPPDADSHQATTGYVGRIVAVPAATPAPPPAPGGPAPRRLVYKLSPAQHLRVVRVVVQVDGHRILSRRGHDLRRVSFARPSPKRIVVRITTYNAHGGGVVTTRSYTGCTRTRLISRPFRRPARRR